MPAVSTNRHSLPPSSTISSTGSRVVPASSLTTTRSSPAALFSSDDLPTFGRPRIATRRGPPISCLATAETSGSTFMISSSRSATPRPWIAETGYGSPRPRFHSAAASGSWRASSILLATRKTGLPLLRSSFTTCSSVEVAPDHRVDDEQHDVAQVDRDLGLRGDGRVDAARVGLPAAGVDEREAAVHPLGLVRHAVAGDAGGVLDDRLAAAEDAVHERGLADVRAADDRDDRQRRQVLDAVLAERRRPRAARRPRRPARSRRGPRAATRPAASASSSSRSASFSARWSGPPSYSSSRQRPSRAPVCVGTTARTTPSTASTVCSKSRSVESTTVTPGAAVRKSTTVRVRGVAPVQRFGDGCGILRRSARRCGARRAPRAPR